MKTWFIEATSFSPEGHAANHGKFLLGRFTPHEWSQPSTVDQPRRLLSLCGWEPKHLLVFDLQTGEGALFRPGGYARADLTEKHNIWTCPLFPPFLTWLYEQDVTDAGLDALPATVEFSTEEVPLRLSGQRGDGSPLHADGEVERAARAMYDSMHDGIWSNAIGLPELASAGTWRNLARVALDAVDG